MNIDDPSLVLANDFLRNHHQTACQNHQVCPTVLQSLQKRRVEGLGAATGFSRDADRRNAVLLRPLQGVGLGIVADDGDDLGVSDLSIVYGVQDGLEIRAAAGYQNCYS